MTLRFTLGLASSSRSRRNQANSCFFEDGVHQIAKVISGGSTNSLQRLEIRYFDGLNQHFMTDYFDVTGRASYAEYDRDRGSVLKPIMSPFQFIVPVPLFLY